jgi:hypothetical protein
MREISGAWRGAAGINVPPVPCHSVHAGMAREGLTLEADTGTLFDERFISDA